MIEYIDNCLLETRGVCLAYGKTRALDSVCIKIRPGEFHALVGSPGEGKSSLCAVLAGLKTPMAGEIVIDGRPTRGLTISAAAASGIELLTKSDPLFKYLSVAENIALAERRLFRPFWFAKRKNLTRVRAWTESVGVKLPLEERLCDVYPDEGEFISILSKLYMNPRLLILDEALESLSPIRFNEVMDLFRTYAARGTSLLWATHRLEDAMNFTDQISVMRFGRILVSGPPSSFDKAYLVRLAFAVAAETYPEAAGGNFYEFLKDTEVVLRDLPLAIAIVNKERRVKYLNATGASFFPGCPEAKVGDEAKAVLGEKNSHIFQIIDAALDAGTEIKSSIESFFAKRGKCLASVQAHLVRGGGETVGVMLVMQDVSEQEAMRRQLALDHNLSSIGLLAAGVAHEVNNPLEIIDNYVNYMKNNPDSPNHAELLEEIEAELENIQRIVQNLVAFSGRSKITYERVDLAKLVGDVSSLLEVKAKEAHIRIACRAPEQPALIQADAREMRQILLNLLRNSLEALPLGGTIYLNVVNDGGGRIWLVVRDTGPGIALESINDVFLPFASSKNNGNNQGLGLSIVHGLVEKFGGVITVNNLEKGCEFALSFPIFPG